MPPVPAPEIPRPSETARLVMSDGAVILLRRHGNPAGRRIALSHGNGLATDALLPFWSLLLDDFDLVLFDIRNHGRNPLHGPEGHVWSRIVRDMEEIRTGIDHAFGPRPVAGAFHSLSAVAAMAHTLDRGARWSPLVLFDPPFFPPAGHPLEPLEQAHMEEMAARSARRPERYRDPAILARQFAIRPEFRRWRPGTHALLARATLRHDPAAGDWVLACPRDYEARIFGTNTDTTLWSRMAGGLPAPVLFIGGDPDLEGQTPPAIIAAAMGQTLPVDWVGVPGTTHFLQVEEPEACARRLGDFLDRHRSDAPPARGQTSAP